MNIGEIGRYAGSTALYNYRNLFREYVNRRSHAAYDHGDQLRDSISCIAEFEARREHLRGKFIESFGGLPPTDTPLNAVVTGVVRACGYRVENVIFESRPKTYVTANLYVPDGVCRPTGAVLFLCGHLEKAKQDGEYHAVCRDLALAGLVVLAQDPIGQGERFSYYSRELGETTVEWGVAEHAYAGHQCLMLGDGIARYFVHDAMRSIDYLCSREEVDPSRIGVTGNSGGGTQASLVMVCDPRLAAAAPTTFIMSRRSYQETEQAQDLEQVWQGMASLGFDHEDILLAMAPRPVLVNAVTSDFFPIEGTRSTVERVRRFWALYGKEDDIRLAEDFSDHHYTAELSKQSALFFSRHLLGSECRKERNSADLLSQRQLQCTASGQVYADFPDARAVHEENLDRLSELTAKRLSIPDRQLREEAHAWLEGRIIGNREPCALNPRFAEGCLFNGLQLQSCFWRPLPGLLNHGLMLRDSALAGRILPVTLALWDGGSQALSGRMKWIYGQCGSGRAVIVLDVSCDGLFLPQGNAGREAGSVYGPLFKFGCDLLWLDDSLSALTVHDVLRAYDMADRWPGVTSRGMEICCFGDCSVIGRLAAFLDDRAKFSTVGREGWTFAELASSRHYDDGGAMRIVLPGLLKYFDLPDLDRWISDKGEKS
jgi:hypothetical protein